MLGKIEGGRRKVWQRMRRWEGITDSMHMNFSKLCELVLDREAWHAAVHAVAKSWTWLSDWTDWLNDNRYIQSITVLYKTYSNDWKNCTCTEVDYFVKEYHYNTVSVKYVSASYLSERKYWGSTFSYWHINSSYFLLCWFPWHLSMLYCS